MSSTWPGQEVVEFGKLHYKQLQRHANPYLIHHVAWKVPFSIPLPAPPLLLPPGHQVKTLTAVCLTLYPPSDLQCITLQTSMKFWMTAHFKQGESGAKSLAKSLISLLTCVWLTQAKSLRPEASRPLYVTFAKNLQESGFEKTKFQPSRKVAHREYISLNVQAGLK